MKLSIIILNYNVRYFLELCLQSVVSATKTLNAEIIVVDNNSQDDSETMVKTIFPEVKWIANKENLGFSKGNNIGVSIAKGQYICILNPDTVVAEDTFIQLLEFAESKANLGIVGCQLVDGLGKFLPESKRNIPTPLVSLKKILGNGRSYYNNLAKDSIGKTDILVGAFMLMKKDLYQQVNGFDEAYFMYGEDIDLSYKVLKQGYTNYYFGKAKVLHFKGESTLRNKQYRQRFYGAMKIFYKKHFKSNPVFNTLIALGIKLSSLIPKKTMRVLPKHNKTLAFTDENYDQLKNVLLQPNIKCKDLNQISTDSLVILDSKIYTHKSIIETISKNGKVNNCVFRILVKHSNFAIGSDGELSRGEIIKF